MAGRRTNLTLLWAAILSLVTGVGSFLIGTSAGRWVVIAHGVVALVIVVLAPWKTGIARRGLKRSRPGKGMSLSLSVVTLVTLATGVMLVTGLADSVGPFTMMQAHVSLGLLTVSLTLVHTLQRPVPHRMADLSRRSFIRAGLTLASAGGIWLALEALLDISNGRGAMRRFTGSHEITEVSEIPATQWLNDRIPHLDRARLRIDVVGTRFTAEQLSAGDRVEATLDCTGGWHTTQTWEGARLDRLLDDVAGRSIVVHSVTGYWRRFPRVEASSLWLATDIAGEPIRDGHGGPVRLVAPGRRGYWWVKWVVRVEIDDHPPWWQPPLPVA